MKKEKQSTKKGRNMTTKSVPKRMQPLLSALTDFMVDITNDNNIRQVMEDNHEELLDILKANMPTQKAAQLKKVKDPDAPKRGKSSYIYFCVDKRDAIKSANPNMSAKDVIKELGRVWREETSDKEKARYTKMSADDKARYEEEMKDYTPPSDVGTLVKKKAKRSGPKRGLTAYIFFCKEHRSLLKKEQPELSTKEVTAELGKRWRELSEKDRKPFVKLATNDKLRYEKEKGSRVESDDSESVPAKKSKKNKSSSKKEKSNPRRKSGYILFCQEERPTLKEQNGDWTNQQVTKELGRLWKELSEEDQAEYNKRAANSSNEPVSKTEKPARKGKGKGKNTKSKAEVEVESESELEELVDESE